ncbi:MULTISPECIES: hypothetical protein, partial [Enterobacter cloacae complex]|uniref:hypothetical protein n=1 Tax=Enterobacter cloacae complex TaxID=354276 RepID=UPI001A980BD7
KGRGTGAHSQRRRAGAEKPPVPYQTGRETLAAGGRFIPRAARRSRKKSGAGKGDGIRGAKNRALRPVG